MIGYYAHDRGAGHVNRGAAIASALSEPVTLLSTATACGHDAFADQVVLSSDVDHEGSATAATANGVLHYAPEHSRAVQRRAHQITSWIRGARPRAMIVDVSVEIALLARLSGVPVVTIGMPGDRSDPAHQLGFQISSRIIAPWTRAVYDPGWLTSFGSQVAYVGSFSRFDGRHAAPPRWPPRQVLVIAGAGGTTLDTAAVAKLTTAVRTRWPARDVPAIDVTVIGGPGDWVADVWTPLHSADLVVSHGGQNTIAEIAAARRPAILVPEARPHDEQRDTVQALARAGIIRMSETWDTVGDCLDGAPPDPSQWTQWAPPTALRRAARVVEAVAAGNR